MFFKRWASLVLLVCASEVLAIGVGESAPAYEVQLFDRTTLSSADLKGRVVLINFWASWCEPCRNEMPALNRFYQKHHGEGFEIITVSMDSPEDVEAARNIMAGFDFSGAWIRQSQVKGFGRIWRIPLTFLIDRQGVLRKDGWYGRNGFDEATLEQVITPLLVSPH